MNFSKVISSFPDENALASLEYELKVLIQTFTE